MQTHGSIQGLRIDGFNVGNGVFYGIDYGGGWGFTIRDTSVVNFLGNGNIGVRFANLSAAGQNASWSEKMRINMNCIKNDTAVLITGGNGATNDSFEYNDLTFYVQASANQNGVVVDKGAFLYRSDIVIRANMADNSGAVLTVQGNDGGVGNSSSISVCRVFIGAEHNNTVNTPQTIKFGDTANNTMNNCTGHLSFGFTASAWTPSNANSGIFSFGGMVNGDNTLSNISKVLANAPSGWPTV